MIKNMVRILVVLFLMIVLIFGFDMIGVIGSDETVQLTISENDNLTTISKKLETEGVILNRYIFKLYCKIANINTTVYPGTIIVQKNSAYGNLVKAISSPQTESVTITIPEGFEVREIIARLSENDLIVSEAEFRTALERYSFQTDQGTVISGENLLEGFLFPDTYQIRKNASPKEIITMMTSNFQSKWTEQYEARAKELGMNIKDIITLASIIEREANKPEDFLLVSSVFHNRLKIGKHLESCATVQYILKERKPVLSISDTKIASPYNTYQNAGLPPAPISAPGLLAIEAALYPDDTEYLYFFTDYNGINHYSKTFEEHNRQIQQYGL